MFILIRLHKAIIPHLIITIVEALVQFLVNNKINRNQSMEDLNQLNSSTNNKPFNKEYIDMINVLVL